ncbi:UDP-3-O-acylglucosamine N-acyltransferase [bacterium BMS3Abin05]|nr:UDP-3-O-acylglucosamine N-acyltransferase [bacterium BMS3Abin05]GBE27409.1 UDP-3-O-acylglucosamine N-acyltransferase [bacterium BMS3Bbin03]HDL78201.1 UDP-3-O-(3-hydroxymyristoyl)glucosamine N-acyltransferase [Bacteroidota bacterium]
MRISELAKIVGGTISSGAADIDIKDVAPIESAGPGAVTFLANGRYTKFLKETKASAVLVPPGKWESSAALIVVDDPYFAFTQVLQALFPLTLDQPEGIHPTVITGKDVSIGERVSIGPYGVIEDRVRIGAGTTIFPHTFIGRGSEIGKDCTIYSNVSIRDRIKIGHRVIIHSGTVIGSDGFGFAPKDGIYHKIPQIGIVVIEDDVEIGANCAIDRAALGETRIGEGVKLDNLIQIAHSVKIGAHTVIAAQSGISGSTVIGSRVVIGGQVGFVGHITVGDGSMFGAQAGVTKSVPGDRVYSGYPAREHRRQLKLEAGITKLPDLIKRVKELENRLKALAPEHHREAE